MKFILSILNLKEVVLITEAVKNCLSSLKAIPFVLLDPACSPRFVPQVTQLSLLGRIQP